jgi:P4 family phage/plasmid primase-like protien
MKSVTTLDQSGAELAGVVNRSVKTISEIETWLGTPLFMVPCYPRTKKPMVKFTTETMESTRRQEYQAMLATNNIAVRLGEFSGGFCAIDFDDDQSLEEFLRVNPLLATSARWKGSRGAQIGVRVTGAYPAPSSARRATDTVLSKNGEPIGRSLYEWRSTGNLSTVKGVHPSGREYQVLVANPPVVLEFSQINWPGGWPVPQFERAVNDIDKSLNLRYGNPYYLNDAKDVNGINERYWAGLYATDNHVLYEPGEEEFYQYDQGTGLWTTVTKARICESIAQRILPISRESGQITLEKQITQQKLKGICGALAGIVEKKDAFKAKGQFIHVANGIIRFADDGGVLIDPFSPEDYSRNQSPIAYDPKAECPRFLAELIYSAVSPEDADLIQRWFGLALLGYNLPQRFLILEGTPAGGKGTLVRILQALVGAPNCCQLRTTELESRFELFRYLGKTLLNGPDVPGDFLAQKSASMLKALVGGDPLTGEAKGSNTTFQMYGTFNVIMTCNSRLRIRLEEDSGAWRRRLLIVRYERPPVAKRIPDFDKVLLREEGSGILRWGIEGFVKLQAELADEGDFRLTTAQQERIDSLLQESDSLRMFVKTRVEASDGGSITTSELVQAYAVFCTDQGWNPLPTTVVERKAPDLMLEHWQVPKSNSLEGEGGRASRGWRNVRLIG